MELLRSRILKMVTAMTKKQEKKPTKAEKLKMIEAAAKKLNARKSDGSPRVSRQDFDSLLRDERQTYRAMVNELANDPDPVSPEINPSKGNGVPSCCRRRVAPSLHDYENSNGSKQDVEGARSVDLSTPLSLDPETALVTNREVNRKVKIVEIAVASAIEDVSEKSGSSEHPVVPECSIRRAAPSMDEYANKKRKQAEGSRSVDLSVLRDDTEEKSED